MDEQQNNLEELKKKLFVDSEVEKENLTELVDRYISLFGFISKDGYPQLHAEAISRLNRKELLKAQISGRAIAAVIDKNIPEDIGIKEIVKWNVHNIPENQIIARVNDLVKEGFVIRKQRGVFHGKIYQINSWLKQMEQILKNG